MINAPHSLNKNDNFVKETISAVEKVTSKKKETVAFPGWSDAGIISNHTPAKSIILGPGNIDQAHANIHYLSNKLPTFPLVLKLYFNFLYC